MNQTDPFAEDRLNRKPDAELLTQLIIGDPRPQVISVDAPWGGGKTTFIRMWSQQLADAGYPVVSHNAWETDFVEDPLVAFIGELEQDLSALRDSGSANPTVTKNWRRLKSLGVGVIRSTGPLAVKIASQGLLDAESVRQALGFVGNSAAPISEYVSKLTEERLDAYAQEKRAIKAFRETLTLLAKELTTGGALMPPLIIFVDELDRCRPSYAIALLERMKHLFSVEGVVFVLALDKGQLAHTVRAIYGQGFGAEGYLRRFIDYDYHLPMPKGKVFVEYLMDRHKVIDIYRNNKASGAEYDSLAAHFSILSQVFGLSLRDQDQAFLRLFLALKAAPTERHFLYTNLMVFFSVLRWGSPDTYHRYMSGRSGISELLDAVRGNPAGIKYLSSHMGQVTLAYLLVSARRDSDARSLIQALQATAADQDADKDERAHAQRVLELVRHFSSSSAGGAHALKSALLRLEKINEQVDVVDYD